MIDFTLALTRSTRFGHAARHLQSCALLSRRIDDWGDILNHEAYLASIRREHARKSGFWGQDARLGDGVNRSRRRHRHSHGAPPLALAFGLGSGAGTGTPTPSISSHPA